MYTLKNIQNEVSQVVDYCWVVAFPPFIKFPYLLEFILFAVNEHILILQANTLMILKKKAVVFLLHITYD